MSRPYVVRVLVKHPNSYTGAVESYTIDADHENDALVKAGAYFGYLFPLSEICFYAYPEEPCQEDTVSQGPAD